MIPFTVEQFLNVFARYNVSVWPAQLFLYALGILVPCLVLQRKVDFSKTVSLILAIFWTWMGAVYHFWFFRGINRAALIFAVFFVFQGILFFITGVCKQQLRFRFALNLLGIVGGAFLLYAIVVYPALGHWIGHRYPAAPTFGLPCPTTIFTFGMLLWTDRRVPLYILAIPLGWSFIGFWAAISLGMTEDYGLLVTGLLGALLITFESTAYRCFAARFTTFARKASSPFSRSVWSIFRKTSARYAPVPQQGSSTTTRGSATHQF